MSTDSVKDGRRGLYVCAKRLSMAFKSHHRKVERFLLIKRDAQVSWQGVCVCMCAVAACCASQTVLFFIFLSNGRPIVHTRAHTEHCYCCFSGPLTPIHLPPLASKMRICIEGIKNKLNVGKNGGKQLLLSPYSIMTFSQRCCSIQG